MKKKGLQTNKNKIPKIESNKGLFPFALRFKQILKMEKYRQILEYKQPYKVFDDKNITKEDCQDLLFKQTWKFHEKKN